MCDCVPFRFNYLVYIFVVVLSNCYYNWVLIRSIVIAMTRLTEVRGKQEQIEGDPGLASKAPRT